MEARPAGRPIRPTIGHLLIWAVGSAVGFEAYRRAFPPLNARVWLFGMIYQLVMGMAVGTFLTGVVILESRRRRGDPSAMSHPGYWLLWFGLAVVAAGGMAIAAYYFAAIRVFHFPSEGDYPPPFWTIFRMASAPTILDPIHQTVGWGLGAVAALIIAGTLRKRFGWPWLAVFVAFALTAAALAVGTIRAEIICYTGTGTAALLVWGRRAYRIYYWLIPLCVIVLLVALASDFRRRHRRDGPHWAGVLAWLGIAAIQFLACIFVP
jgi:hypothetical protein